MKYLTLLLMVLFLSSCNKGRIFWLQEGDCFINSDHQFRKNPTVYKVVKIGLSMVQVKVKYDFEKEVDITQFEKSGIYSDGMYWKCPENLK